LPSRSARYPALAASLLTLAACGSAPGRSATLQGTSGCYALARRDSPSVSLRLLMPETIELDTATHRNPDGRPYPRYPHVLHPLGERPGTDQDALQLDSAAAPPMPSAWERAYVLKVWRFTPPDSVAALLHQNMDASWELRFRAIGDSLTGTATYYDDGPDTFTLPLVAHRVDCPPRTV